MAVQYKRTVIPRVVFNYHELETRIGIYCVVNRISKGNFAALLGFTYSSLRYKLDGVVPFTTYEMYALKDKLSIKDEEMVSIFLTPLVEG